MRIERIYPPEVAALRARLFEVMEYEIHHTVDGRERYERTEPIVKMIMDTEDFAEIRCVLDPDEFSFVFPKGSARCPDAL